MIEIRRTELFKRWLEGLRDRFALARILKRIDRLGQGNPGKWRSVGDGVIEMKIDYGPGYRVYYVSRGNVAVVLLVGGDKSSQERDIRKAKELAENLDEEELDE
jgi:putative addiction module killer protein